MGNVLNTARSICSSTARAVGAALRVARNMASRYWRTFSQWVSQPHIRRRLLIGLGVGAVILVLVPLGIATFGFGPAGIIAGSAAAGLQSAIYGGFVPAGSLFAALTSAGATGALFELAVIPAAVGAVSSAALFHKHHSGD